MFLCAGMKAERWIATDLEGLDPGQDRVRHGNRLQSTERGLRMCRAGTVQYGMPGLGCYRGTRARTRRVLGGSFAETAGHVLGGGGARGRARVS
jgi:hypothetical protein